MEKQTKDAAAAPESVSSAEPQTPEEEIADLAVTKIAGAETAAPGDVLDYRITVTNLGPGTAENAAFTDNVPETFLDARISYDEGATFTPWTGTETIGELAQNQSRTFIIRGVVSENAVLPLVNEVEVTASTPDPNPDNNQAAVTTEIRSPRAQALQDIIKATALQEAALARILDAEGEKLQRAVGLPGADIRQLAELNSSVRRTLNAVTRLQTVMLARLHSVM